MPTELLLVNPSRPRRRLRRRLKSRKGYRFKVPSKTKAKTNPKPKRKKHKAVKTAKKRKTTMAKRRKKSKVKVGKRRLSRKQKAALAKGRAKRLKKILSKRRVHRKRRRKNPSRAQVRAAMKGTNSGTKSDIVGAPKPKRRRRKKKHAAAVSHKKHRKGGKKRRKVSKVVRQRRRRVRKLSAKIKKTHRYLKMGKKRKGSKRRKSSTRRKILRTRLGALQLQKKAARGKMSKKLRGKMAAYGLSRVNPSLKGVWSSFVSILPEIGVGAVAVVGTAWVGSKVAEKLATVASIPESMKPYVPAISVGAVSIAAYIAMQMAGAKVAKYSLPVLLCGMAVATVKASQKFMMKDGLSLASKAGLGDYVLGDYVPVGGYLPQGDYVSEGMGSIFNESTLGGTPMLTDGSRDVSHGVGGEPSVYDYEEQVDTGILSGGIFDD